MAPLFDSYIIVDWSAANQPCLGKDSIWLAMVRREKGARRETMRENLATRLLARRRLADLLAAEVAAERSVFVGFDFAFGYPQGFAARLGLNGLPWRATWDLLAAEIRDADGNANNRFEVAAKLNQRIDAGIGPFWGCPRRYASAALGETKPVTPLLAERRITEARTRGTKPVWQLYYNGSVGSQTLVGIPVLDFLRHHPPLASAARIWPFETGLRVPARQGGAQIVLGEIYPSSIKVEPAPGQVKDEAQVQALSQCFAQWDEDGSLAPLFAGDPALTADERAVVENEEGWILAMPGKAAAAAPARYDYLRDADDIYRESSRLIRASVALERFPGDLQPLVLRLVHAAAEPAIADDLRWSEDAVATGRRALRAGAPLLVDAGMVAAGIARARLPSANEVVCTLDDPHVAGLARRLGTTRSAAAVELWRPRMGGAVIAIGNAPTALFHLLEMIAAGAPRPALVLGFPVGFVGATEAKAALAQNPWRLPFVTLVGRRGGSALAAAAVNALAAPEALP